MIDSSSGGSPAVPLAAVAGVYTVPIRAFPDERGCFMETFRQEWFPQVSWAQLQGNRSESKAGVLRGLHYHLQQVDYWIVPRGVIRAGLVDLRRSSPTYRSAVALEMGDANNIGLFIPVGVAHGFLALTDCTVTYLVNRYYAGGSDEFGVMWNDPALHLDWQLDGEPILSQRDRQNPRLQDIPAAQWPK